MLPIDFDFDTDLANELAKLESYNKHLYRPNTYLHKWWARRCGTTFRLILKHLIDTPAGCNFYTPGGLQGKTILDPMMGGGTTLHEGIRLGASVIGADLDPIPVLQARATLSEVDMVELEAAFAGLLSELEASLSSFYDVNCPVCARPGTQQYTLYGNQRHCACGPALIIDSLTLRHNNDGSRFHLCSETGDVWLDDTLFSARTAGHIPLVEKKTTICRRCNKPYQEDKGTTYYQRYVPIVVAGQCDEDGVYFAAPRPGNTPPRPTFNPTNFPIQHGPKTADLHSRGVTSYLDLFTNRQLHYLKHSLDYLSRLDEPLIQLNLALLVSTSLEFNSLLCGYKGAGRRRAGAIRHTFTYHAFTFPYTALENNPVYPRPVSGSLRSLFHFRLRRARQWAQAPVERQTIANGKPRKVTIPDEKDSGLEVVTFDELGGQPGRFLLIQGSSSQLDLPDNSIDAIVTDPPYFDSVQYSDLASFFHVWLKAMLPNSANWQINLADSAVDPYKNGQEYTDILSDIFKECHRVLKPDIGRLIFTFHNRNPRGWSALTIALQRAHFTLLNHYIVHAENPASVHITPDESLQHDTILVLKSEIRDQGSGIGSRGSQPRHQRPAANGQQPDTNGQRLGYLLDQRLPEPDIHTRWEKWLTIFP